MKKLLYRFFNDSIDIRLSVGRSKNDPEKAVMPALVFISFQHPKYAAYKQRGFALILGWWDFDVSLYVIT